MFNFKVIGARIKQLRKAKGITQEVLAEKLGVSTEHICRIERGTYRPSCYLIENLATALNVDEQTILFGTKTDDFQYKKMKDKFSALSEDKKTAVLQIIDLISD